MPKFIKTGPSKSLPEALSLRLKYYPLRIITYLVLAGISSAFLVLSLSYLLTTFHTNFNNFSLPLLFHANTIIILGSSYAMLQTRKAARAEDTKAYLTGLLITVALGGAFTAFQIMAWNELVESGINFTNNIAGTYLYVISGLHLIHLVVGVGLLGLFAFNAAQMVNDPVKELLFQTNPFNKLKVDLLATYWHFVDALWLYLYLFFLVNVYLLGHH